MNSAFINSENAGTVMAWCSVLTLAMGVGMTVYQMYQQQKRIEEMREAQEAMKTLSMPEPSKTTPMTA